MYILRYAFCELMRRKARTLINTPKIVFADEPTSDMDNETTGAVIESLVNLVRRHRACLVVCAHGDFPKKIADREYVLSDGKIAGQ